MQGRRISYYHTSPSVICNTLCTGNSKRIREKCTTYTDTHTHVNTLTSIARRQSGSEQQNIQIMVESSIVAARDTQ